MDFLTLWVSLKLAILTTLILALIGIPTAYWLATTRVRGRGLIEAILALPLVLPPTVLGFYLLLVTGPQSSLGSTLESITGATLPFTFSGILLASVIFNLPQSIRPFTVAFSLIDPKLREAAWCLGVSRWETFRRISVPLAWPGILAGMALTFAHTLGEFGVILMMGGNIPGVTRTLSIAIYDDVQALDYRSAAVTSWWMLGISLAILLLLQRLQRRIPEV